MCPADNLETQLLTKMICWAQILKYAIFGEVYDD